MGAEVLLLDQSVSQLRRAQDGLEHPVATMLATRPNIERALSFADIVVAAPAVRGHKAPTLVTREMLGRMRPRSVLMDLAIDMGGCCETSRPSYFPRPVYEVDDILHFCAPNLPTIAARSATLALTNAVLPYVLETAAKGFERALTDSMELRRGTYLYRGHCTMESLAHLFGLAWEPLFAPQG
jgi:alanine dehydrogenase